MSKRIAKKVLLIGWDAADWKVIMPLIKQGKMPTLAKFMSEFDAVESGDINIGSTFISYAMDIYGNWIQSR